MFYQSLIKISIFCKKISLSVDVQYHLRCYDEFRIIPKHADQTPLIVDGAMKAVVDEMYENRQLCTWTSIELHGKYLSYMEVNWNADNCSPT